MTESLIIALNRLQTDLDQTRAALVVARNALEAERRAREIAQAELRELRDHVERVHGAEMRPSMAIRALLLRARGRME